MSDWFYAQGADKKGPVTETEIREKISSGILSPASLVWKKGMAAWTAVSAVPELTAGAASSLPGETPLPTATSLNPSANGSFTVGSIFGEAWGVFKKNAMGVCVLSAVFMVVSTAATLVLGIVPLLGFVANSFVQGFLLLGFWKGVLAVVDGRPAEVGVLFSESKQWWRSGLANSAYGFTVGAFTLLLIVPGLIVSALFALWGLLVVDRGLDPFAALGESYYLVKPNLFTWFLLGLVSLILIFVGILLLVVGVIPALSLATLTFCTAYRRLQPRAA